MEWRELSEQTPFQRRGENVMREVQFPASRVMDVL
jgi:hypothetical protein